MINESIISAENLVYDKPELMNENYMHYCPGCSHGVVHKLVGEVIKDMGIQVHNLHNRYMHRGVPYKHSDILGYSHRLDADLMCQSDMTQRIMRTLCIAQHSRLRDLLLLPLSI